jgi:hypothetical protein
MHFTTFDFIVSSTFLISISVFFQKSVPLYLKLFPLYFLTGLSIGLRAEWLFDHGKYNTGILNVWSTIEFCFYFFVMQELIASKRIKQQILYVSVAYALFAFSNLIFIHHRVGFNPVNFTIGCVITVLICIYYFMELFQRAVIQSFFRLPEFWISSAILINTILCFPLNALEYFLEESTKVGAASQYIYKNIDLIGTIILALTFIFYMMAFLCRIRISRYK